MEQVDLGHSYCSIVLLTVHWADQLFVARIDNVRNTFELANKAKNADTIALYERYGFSRVTCKGVFRAQVY